MAVAKAAVKRLEKLCMKKVEAKIDHYGGVTEKDIERCRCIDNFLAAQRVEDRCCGTCGVRDPDDVYTQSCQLTTLDDSHWAVVPPQALDRPNAEKFRKTLAERIEASFLMLSKVQI